MKAHEYRLVSHATVVDLNDEINKLLEEGWELYGEPIVSVASSAEVGGKVQLHYARSQAMIKIQHRGKPGF